MKFECLTVLVPVMAMFLFATHANAIPTFDYNSDSHISVVSGLEFNE